MIPELIYQGSTFPNWLTNDGTLQTKFVVIKARLPQKEPR
jgi:hypothetical protein